MAESTIKLSNGVEGLWTILVNVSIKKKTILGCNNSSDISCVYFSRFKMDFIHACRENELTFITFLSLTRPPYKGKVQKSCSADKQTDYVNVLRRDVHKCT